MNLGWYSEYDVGEMSDVLLRATAIYVFASAPGRRYWQNAGRFWRDNYTGRRARRFHQILEETYQEAIKNPAAVPPVERSAVVPAEPGPVAQPRWPVLVVAAVGGAAVAVLVRVIRQLRVGRR